jgi:PAS domain S-box-containing protein
VAIVITDISGAIEYVNPQFTKLTGYTLKEAEGRNPRFLKADVTPAEEYRHLWDSIIKGKIWQGEFCNKKKNGELYWEAATIAPILDKAGAITNFVAVKVDITGQKFANEELLFDALRFENLYELAIMGDQPKEFLLDFSLEAAVQITASSIGYIYLMDENETSLTLHAWSKSVMPACTMPIKPTKHRVEETGLWGEAVRQRKPVITNDYDAPNPMKKGYPEGHVPIKRHMNIPLIYNGKIVMIAGVGNKSAHYTSDDVQHLTLLMASTWQLIEEKQFRNALRESEERFRQLFDQDDDAIIIMGLSPLKITDANPAALKLFGVTLDELLNISPRRLIGKDCFREFIIALRNAADEGFLLPKLTCRRFNREHFHVSLKGKVIRLRDEKVIYCTIRDITEKLRTEEHIRTTQAKLIQANKMTSLRMLVSSVAHEINNPNHCISINTAVLSNIWKGLP